MHTTKENDPVLSREEALSILNTPDDQLDDLIARAEKLRRKYKGNHVSIHILTAAATVPRTAHTVHNPAVPPQILKNTNGFPMRNCTRITILSMNTI